MNRNQNSLNRMLIVVGLLTLVAIASYFMVIQQKLNQVAASRAQLDSLQSQYADLKRVADQKPLYLALIRQVQSRLTGVELTADPRAYVPSYLKQIEDLAQRDGLVVTSVAPQPLPTPSGSPAPAPVATGASSIQNTPIIGAPLTQAGKALNRSNTMAQEQNQQIAQAGGAAAMTGATPMPVPSGGVAPGVRIKGTAKTSPRANAIVYLNQSFQQVPISMELTGTYGNLQKFLRDLNKFPKLIGVGNVALTSNRGGVGETPKLHIVLPIVAYRLSPSGPPLQATPPPGAPGGG